MPCSYLPVVALALSSTSGEGLAGGQHLTNTGNSQLAFLPSLLSCTNSPSLQERRSLSAQQTSSNSLNLARQHPNIFVASRRSLISYLENARVKNDWSQPRRYQENEDIWCSLQRKIQQNSKSCSTSIKRESASRDSTIWLINDIVLCHCALMLLGDKWERTRGEVPPARLSWAHHRLQHPSPILRPHRTFPGAVIVAAPNILVQAHPKQSLCGQGWEIKRLSSCHNLCTQILSLTKALMFWEKSWPSVWC